MRKVLPILLAIAIAAPALADVMVSGAAGPANGQLTVTITPSGGAAIRGVALLLNAESGDAVIDAVGDVVTNGKLNTNIDYFFTNGTGMVTTPTPESDDGHPLADPDAAGVLDLTTPKARFSLSSGYLDAAGTQLGQTDPITFVITYTGTAGCISIEQDALRGGIVGDALGTVTYANGTASPVCLTFGPPPCRDRLTAAEKIEYDKYIAAGYTVSEMDCWCWQYQCRGDYSNATEGISKYRIYSADLTGLTTNWKKKIVTGGVAAGGADPRADFSHGTEGISKYAVYSADLTILTTNWKRKDTAGTLPAVVVCPSYYVAP